MKLFQSLNLLGFGRLASGLGLLLGLLGPSLAAQAQATPAANRWDVEPGTKVYLDGQPSTAATIDQLSNEAVASVENMAIYNNADRAALPDYKFNYIVLTTKANANSPTTLALADKLHLASAHITQPASISAVAPSALAYITSHYPKAWLGGEVVKMTRKSTGAVKYRVQLADNWGWRYVSFTEAGKFVDDGM